MSAPTLKRRELLCGFAYFIPAGETVDAVEVKIDTWPDGDPVTNYGDYAFPDVERYTEEIETEEVPFTIPTPAGIYQNQPETHLRGKSWLLTTAKTNSLVKMLQHGLPTPAAAEDPQEPGVNGLAYIDGVLLLEAINNGVAAERVQTWARMTLADPGEKSPTTSKIQLRFRQLYSGNNTYEAL